MNSNLVMLQKEKKFLPWSLKYALMEKMYKFAMVAKKVMQICHDGKK